MIHSRDIIMMSNGGLVQKSFNDLLSKKNSKFYMEYGIVLFYRSTYKDSLDRFLKKVNIFISKKSLKIKKKLILVSLISMNTQ